MRTHNIPSCYRKSKRFLLSLLTWRYYQPSLARTTPSQTNFHGPEGVRAIEVLLYEQRLLKFQKGNISYQEYLHIAYHGSGTLTQRSI